MSELVPSRTIIEFQPAAGWQWLNFDGCIEIESSISRMMHTGDPIAVDSDIRAVAPKLCGRQYTAEGFDDTPGTVANAEIEIEYDSLCKRVVIEGHKTVSTATSGTFQVKCTPSMKSGAPPVPDPQPNRDGTWRLQKVRQPRTKNSP